MNKIRVTGWRYGLDKIGMTKTIRVCVGCGLAEAKRYTDQMLEGIKVTLDVSNAEAAQILVRGLNALGADAVLESVLHP